MPWDSESLLIPKAIAFYGGVSATVQGWLAAGQTLGYNGCWSGPPSYTYGIETANGMQITVTTATGATNLPATARRYRSVVCPDGYSQLPNGACRLNGADPGKNNNICQAGANGSNPIHSALGTKLQQEIDYSANPSDRLRFVRSYTSANSLELAGLGAHWQHNYARKIVFVDSVLATAGVSRENGDRYYFNRDASGVFVGDADVNGHLIRLINATGQTNGWQYLTDDQTELYDDAGKLLSIKYRDGLQDVLTYSTNATPASIAPGPNLLITVQNSFGRSLNFIYDLRGRIVKMVDPAGNAYSYAYDLANNLISVTYPDDTPADLTNNPKKTYIYGELANTANVSQPTALTGLIDENNQRFATWTYNAGRAISSEHAGGVEKTSLTYNTDGTTSVTDPLNSTRKYRFQLVLGVLKSAGVDQPGGSGCAAASNNMTYDVNGNVASRTDFNGNRTNYVYDLSRNLETSRTEGLTAAGANTPQTRTITTEWHPTFRLPTKITEPGLETSYSYDSHGQISQKTLKDTVTLKTRIWTIAYTYSMVVPGALLQKVENGPRTDVADSTTTDYYAPDAVCTGGHFGCRGQISKITNALGHITQIPGYNAHGQPETVIDANGLTTSLVYDPRQRPISMSSGSELTQFKYDNAGQFIRLTRPDASFLAYNYDDAHRLTQVSDNLGNKVVYTLDPMGNRLKEDTSDPTGQLTETRRREYDALNRQAKAIGASNQTTVLGYDSQGNLTDITDPLLHTTSKDYDNLNRLIYSTDPNNYATQFGYDSLDHLKTVTDAKGLNTTVSYDALDNLLQRQSPDTGTISRTYDSAGNRLTETDAKSQLTAYSYDALNRVSQISYAGGAKLVYTYDIGVNSLGRLSTLTDPNGATSYGYDSHGRVISDTRTINTRNFVTQYRYDTYGRPDRITYPSGRLVNYSFDTQGRINGITTMSTQATFTAVQATRHAPFGGVTGFTLGNGFMANRNTGLDGRIASYSLGNATVSLGYDPASRIISTQESGTTGSRIFDYDPLDRLIHTQVPNAVYDYSYDAVGNRLTEKVGSAAFNYTYPTTSHRLTSVSGPNARSFGYDNNGSMTGNGSQQFSYNSLGRLNQVITAQGTYQYRINGLGQRVMKIPPTGNRTLFHYGLDGRLLAETDGLGVVVQEYIWHGATPVAIVLPLSGTNPERIYYIHADQLNTPRVVVTNSNAVLWRWDPEPFGTAPPNEDVDGNGKKLVMNLGYPGQYYDQETGLNYNNFRDYDSSIGRYVQSDPIGLAGGINTYAYVSNNPLRYTDPLGLSKFDKLYGLPKQFWNWYHRQAKRPGDSDLTKDEARELHKEWDDLGKPKPDSKGKQDGFVDPDLFEWLVPWPLIPSGLGCGELDCNHNGIPDNEEKPSCK